MATLKLKAEGLKAVKAKKLKSEPLRLIQFQREWIPKDEVVMLPKGLRGIYVLYRTKMEGTRKHFNVVYVGMSASGIKGRIRKHSTARNKQDLWDTCSVFVVWPNIRVDEIRELEGILRHIFRKDSDAQELNSQGTYLQLLKTAKVELSDTNRRLTESVSDAEDVAEDIAV